MKSPQEPLKDSARDFYLNAGTFAEYEAKFRSGKNLLDDRIEDGLLRRVFTRYVQAPRHVLEIGAYSGRVTRKLSSYATHITVSDTAAELLRHFDRPTLVLDLAANPDGVEPVHAYDVIVSIGHQISISCAMSNAIAIFDRLLTSDGIVVFDIWNEALPVKYDPPYALEKAGRPRVEELLRRHGFRLLEYRSGCRIPYRFPRTFSRLFRRSGNRFLFSGLAALESCLFRFRLFEGREQNQYFIAARSAEAGSGTLD